MESIEFIINFITNADPKVVIIIGLLGFIYASHKKYVVFGWTYQEKVKELSKWKMLALEGTNLADSSASVAELSQAIHQKELLLAQKVLQQSQSITRSSES